MNAKALPALRILAVSVVSSLLSLQAYAAGCHIKSVSPIKQLTSQVMANIVQRRVIAIEKAMNARGQQLHVVLLARSGEKLDEHDLIQDERSVPLQDYLDQLKQVYTWHADKGIRRTYADGRVELIQPDANRMPGIPKEYVSKEKLFYSHFGIYIKRDTAANLKAAEKVSDWVMVSHLLAECDKDKERYGDSFIFNHPIKKFFWDDKDIEKKKNPTVRAQIIVPKTDIQLRLRELLNNEKVWGSEGLHTPKYNVAATPFSLRRVQDIEYKNRKCADGQLTKCTPAIYQTKFQNSNQWPLEMIAAANKPAGAITNRRQAQDFLWATNFRPSLVQLAGVKSMACTVANKFWRKIVTGISSLVNCEHQAAKEMDVIQLITVKSAIDYMAENHMLADNVEQPGFAGVYEVSIEPKVMADIVAAARVLDAANKLDPTTDPNINDDHRSLRNSPPN